MKKVTKSEYKIVILSGEGIRKVRPPNETEETLNEPGREGQEIVGLTTLSWRRQFFEEFICLCKRPLEEE